ncbi:hypothetical protein VE00_09995 [Pseudogymnoascus sp. WSF 3629]|nr:hypothetical protein VE00_09995 [Pseudogymnoascus sp. WSF 3629]
MAKDASLSPSSTDSGSGVGSIELVMGKQDEMAYWPTITTKDRITGWLRDNDYIVDGDKLAFGSSIAVATVCFGLSATFHTLRSHSHKVHHFWEKMDIFGICVLALGAGSSMTLYAFYCRPVIQRVYWGLNLFSALAAAVVLFDTGGGGSRMKTLRGGVFTMFALSALLPFFHSAGPMGRGRARSEIGAVWAIRTSYSTFAPS